MPARTVVFTQLGKPNGGAATAVASRRVLADGGPSGAARDGRARLRRVRADAQRGGAQEHMSATDLRQMLVGEMRRRRVDRRPAVCTALPQPGYGPEFKKTLLADQLRRELEGLERCPAAAAAARGDGRRGAARGGAQGGALDSLAASRSAGWR